MWLNIVPGRPMKQQGRSNNAIRVAWCSSWEPFGATKAISLEVDCVLLLLRTQPTQHRVCTKAPKLRGSGEKKAILLQFDCVFCFRRRSRRRTNSAPRPLSHRGRGPKCHFTAFDCVLLLLKAADAGPNPDRGPTKPRPRPTCYRGARTK